jgi:hypothetical protein
MSVGGSNLLRFPLGSHSILRWNCIIPLSYLCLTTFLTNTKQIRNKFETNSKQIGISSNLSRICYVFVSYLFRIC